MTRSYGVRTYDPPQSLGVFDYYADSVNGSDSNNGLTPATAKQSLAGINALGSALINKRVGLARNSVFREQFTFPQSGIKFDSYGSGARYKIYGSDLTNLSWSPYSGTVAGSNLIQNQSLETWSGSPLTPDNWTTIAVSPSTVNRVAGNTGTYAAELSIGTGNQDAEIYQTVTYAPNQSIQLSFDHREPDGGLVGYQFLITSGPDSGKYLQVDGSFNVTDPGNQGPASASVGSFATYTRTVTMPNSSGLVKLNLKRKIPQTGGVAYRLWIDNVHLDTGGTDIPANTYQCNLTVQTYNVFYLDVDFHSGSAKYALNDQEFIWEASKLYVRDTRGTPPANIEIGRRDSAFVAVNKDDIEIKNGQLEHFNDRAVNLNQCDNAIISHNRINGTSRRVDNGAIAINHSNGCQVRFNTITNSKDDAIYGFNAKTALIEGNSITKCNGDAADGIQLDYYSDGTNNNGANANCLILNNYIDQRGALSQKGCIITTQGDGIIIRGNICYGGTFGIAPNGNNQLVENNIIIGSGSFGGLRIAKAYSKDGNTYQNNQISGCVVGINTDFVVESGESLTGTEKLTNCLFQNNTVVNCTQYGVLFSTPMGGSFINNIVDCPSVTGHVFRMNSISSGSTWTSNNNNFGPEQTNFMNFNGTTYATLAAWKTARSSDAGSTHLTPIYVDSANNKFNQASSSPTVAIGSNIT